MEPGNICCPLCTSRTVQCFCICQFPLPPLCASEECAEAHVNKKSGLFHYFLPTSASNCINARNHRSLLQWIVGLNHTQSKLTASLSLLDATAIQIEEAYQRQVTALAALKDQYISKVNQMREVATEAFKSAVRETTENAINSEYIPQSDITQWVWTMASKAEDDDTPLFQSEVKEIEEVNLTFSVKVISAFKSIRSWNIDCSESNSKIERETENPIENEKQQTHKLYQSLLLPDAPSQIEEAKATNAPHRGKPLVVDMCTKKSLGQHEPKASSESWAPEKQSLPQCKVCSTQFSPNDASFQCPNACLCKLCSIEHVVALGRSVCVHCNKPFNGKVVSMMQALAKRCHVCGISFPLNAFAANARCGVCLRCIKISKPTAKCMKCRDYIFPIKAEDAERIKAEPINYACCIYAEGDLFDSTLRCGHRVCKVHIATLLVCRACRAEVSIK